MSCSTWTVVLAYVVRVAGTFHLMAGWLNLAVLDSLPELW